ncbi:hypothetical protein [Actinoplanes sp. N902-109]|uniref:hypothetical protein n=1 Tax=Actinoplanes sp. (strain N902-109) TaxID=649831 RepID=UPI000329465A|nr:hypothetical protein [Actinoplanes sp. N902-109]AGL14745.1 hypothetical protein L083_1235 [Actinoplanes sp. N902-109]
MTEEPAVGGNAPAAPEPPLDDPVPPAPPLDDPVPPAVMAGDRADPGLGNPAEIGPAADPYAPHGYQPAPYYPAGPYAHPGPAGCETVPVGAPGPGQPRPVRVGRGTGKLPKGLITAYFAGGLALLVVGVVAVVYLAVRAYGGATESITVSGSERETPVVTHSRSTAPAAEPTAEPVAPDPSDPARARFGPQQLANGKSFVVDGENNSKFEVTVTAGKFRRSACDIYSVKPREGGYLPVKLKVKVMEGEPTISEYDFKFEEPDGSWLPSVGGSGCDGKDYGGFLRHLSAGRSYSSSVVFDVPGKKGDIVFVYPIMDVVASWKIG